MMKKKNQVRNYNNLINRRQAISKIAAVSAGLGVAVVAAGIGGYLAGTQTAPARTVEKTVTVPGAEKTVIVERTVEKTVTLSTTSPTVSPTKPAERFEGVKLSYISMSGPPADGVKVLAPKIKEKYGIDVEVIDVPWEVYFSKLTTEFVSGKAVYDVAWLDTVFMPAYVELGILQPIDDLIESDKDVLPPMDEFVPIQVDYATYGGKFYAWFYTCNFNNLWVRSDILLDPKNKEGFEKQYGYPIDEFIKQPDWIKFNDVIEYFHKPPEMYGYVQPLVWPQLSFPAWHTRWFTLTGKPEIDEDWEPWFDRMGLNGIMSIELIKYQMKFMPPGILSMDNPDAASIYFAGKAAVMTGWDTFVLGQIAQLKGDPNAAKIIKNTIHLPPIGGPKGHAVYTNIGHLIGITTAVKDPVRRRAAWTLIKEVTSPENEPLRAAQSGQGPATKTGWRLFAQSNPDIANMVERISEYMSHSCGVAYGPYVGDIITAFQNNLAPAVAGEKDPEKALKDIADAYRSFYAEYKKKGIKNTHGLNIPPWKGEDYTDKLRKQIGL
jgi:multiple sugar transport system substrate-binding protein